MSIIKWMAVLTMVCNPICKVFIPAIVSGGTTTPFLASSVKVAALGDSVTLNGYPPYLPACAGGQALNYGEGHTSINGALKYTDATMWQPALSSQADIFILMFGINDSPSYSWNGVQPFIDAYNAMIDQVIATNPDAEIVLMTPTRAYASGLPTNDVLINGDISQAVRDLVMQRNMGATIPPDKLIHLIDMNALTANHQSWTTDGIHHNATGIAEITQIVCSELSALNLQL